MTMPSAADEAGAGKDDEIVDADFEDLDDNKRAKSHHGVAGGRSHGPRLTF
jgi:hypothetical protein